MQPEIRPLRMDDRERMRRFFSQMSTQSRVFFDLDGCNSKWCERYFDGTDDYATFRFVAVENDEVVGYVILWDVDTKLPWLGIATAECMRGHHLGRPLLEYAENWARENGMGGIMLTTHVANIYAQLLYTTYGFKQLGMCSENNELLYILRFES